MTHQWRYILASLIVITSLGVQPLLASKKVLKVEESEIKQQLTVSRRGSTTSTQELVVDQTQGVTTIIETEDGPVIIPKMRIRKTVEEPSPFSQPHYWRGLMLQSLGVGCLGVCGADPQDVQLAQNIVRLTNPKEAILGLGGMYYAWRSGLGAFFKVGGAYIGYQIGKAVGAGLIGRYSDPLFCGMGTAIGFAAASILFDATKHSVRCLLGWNKKITYETLEKTE
ncbi:MAG: hypothetical protein ACTHJ4_04530 [Candidatus Nucleicultricaceae bacterium]